MKNHKLFYGSSYDRGLDYVLEQWPQIIERFPDAELHICYGWNLFLSFYSNNPERMAWYTKMCELMQQKGVTDHGRLGKQELAELRKSCGIWAYPTEFTEISCITAMECQNDGLVPVVTSVAALVETVGAGSIVSERKDWLVALFSYMDDVSRWETESKKAHEFAQKFGWDDVAKNWAKEFFKPVPQDIKVTVITPTNREGFWHIMADNLSNQTYKNFEWIIVDDHSEDRIKVAQKYAQKFNLDITYQRGNKTRDYGVSHAYNVGCSLATGELIVSLQDFMLLPPNGLELLVREYKNHPDALLAPVDMYFQPKSGDTSDPEDHFSGETDVMGDVTRQNARITNQGIRSSDNPADFELNIGAFSKKTFDELGGFYELFDDSLANFGNTEFAYRALKMGKEIYVFEHICGLGIEHGVSKVEPNLPRYLWLVKAIESGDLGLKRDVAIDTMSLKWQVPEKLDPIEYAEKYAVQIADKLYDGSFGHLRSRP